MAVKKVITETIKAGGKCTPAEYGAILKAIESKAPCNVLVFGTGHDSKMWNDANKGGKTVFIENIPKWAGINPDLDVRLVKYETKHLAKDKIHPDSVLTMQLDADLTETKWDVIFVDSPVGKTQGRMKSIFTGFALSANNGTALFVHDYNRPNEQLYCDHYAERFDFDTKVVDRLFCATPKVNG